MSCITCPKCSNCFPEDNFIIKEYKDKKRNQSSYTCKFCLNLKNLKEEKMRKERDENKRNFTPFVLSEDYQRDAHYRSCYNITVKDYNKIFEAQNGYCAICGKHQSEFKKRLHIDHCHETGVIRGLLCNQCNIGLGCFKDNTDSLEKAAEYLKKTRKN